MRTFKFLMAAIALLCFVLISCEKEVVEVQTAETVQTYQLAPITKEQIKEAQAVIEASGGKCCVAVDPIGVDPIDDDSDNDGTVAATTCCEVTSVVLATMGNNKQLEIDYIMGPDDMELRVYQYIRFGTFFFRSGQYITIDNDDVVDCTADGVNIGTGFLPSGAQRVELQIVSNDGTNCGDEVIFNWVN